MRAGVPWGGGGHPGWVRPSDDPFLRALQSRVAAVRAPESLRLRIRLMLAAEHAATLLGEPEPDPPR